MNGTMPSGICENCKQWAEKVTLDHRIPKFEGGKHDTSNLQWLCLPCEDVKTRLERKRFPRGKRVGNGAALRNAWTPERREAHRQRFLGRKLVSQPDGTTKWEDNDHAV